MQNVKAVNETEIDSLADDLRRSVGDFVRAIRQGSGTTRLTQSETLDWPDGLGAMYVATLAETRAVTHQTMQLVVAQLETSGLVVREAAPSDRRSRWFSPSAAGRDLLARERTGRTSHIADEIRSKLSPAECDLLRNATMIIARLAAP